MHRLLAIALVTACGVPGVPVLVDAGPLDVRPDPFQGMFDEVAEFPHTNCTPGSLSGFARAGYWPDLGMRTTSDGVLQTFVAGDTDDLIAEHTLAADDLLVRVSAVVWTSGGSAWRLKAIDLCGVDADGTLRGSVVTCEERFIGSLACDPEPVTAALLRRIAGEADGDHLVMLGELRGDWPTGVTANLRVEGDIAVLARGLDGIRIVSVANPAAPVALAHSHSGNRDVSDVELVRGVDGRRYVIAGGKPASQIIDITDPEHPQLVAEVPFAADAVAVEGPVAYFVSEASARIDVYDLSLPPMPKRIARFEPVGSFAWHDVFVAGGIAYLSDTVGAGLHVVDFRDPNHPLELGASSTFAAGTAHEPGLTLVGGASIALDASEGRGSKLRILDGDLAKSTVLDPISEFQLRELQSIHQIVALGSRVYIAHHRDGVRVLDLSVPSAPVQRGYFNTWVPGTGGARFFEGAIGIELARARKRIYVSDSIRGLVILEGDATVFP